MEGDPDLSSILIYRRCGRYDRSLEGEIAPIELVAVSREDGCNIRYFPTPHPVSRTLTPGSPDSLHAPTC